MRTRPVRSSQERESACTGPSPTLRGPPAATRSACERFGRCGMRSGPASKANWRNQWCDPNLEPISGNISEVQTAIIGFVPAPLTRDPSETDIAMMRRALLAAEEAASKGEVPVGAVVARGEEILSVAANEREATGDPTSHAELLAIRRASVTIDGWRLTDCTLYATLEPCPMCAGAAHAPPASIIPSSSKAAFSKIEPPHCSVTSSSIVAGDPERPQKPCFHSASNILYNVLELEAYSSWYSTLSLY